MVNLFFTRYPSGGNRKEEIETIFSECMTREEYDARERELSDLYRSFKIDMAPVLIRETIERLPKGMRFNDFKPTGEIVYVGAYPFDSKDKKRRRNAGDRLCRFLESVDDQHDYHYRSVMDILPEGYHYNYCLSFAERFGDGEKELYMKRKIGGRKASITRTLNKAKEVRNVWRNTLLPDEYRTDARYVSLLGSLRNKRSNLRKMMNISVDRLPELVHEADIFIVEVGLGAK
ncbi:MAG: hypothetical protein PHT07_10070 [Paludibacter sp.]|nr:hypothetical protein [Paludibacter sp.]